MEMTAESDKSVFTGIGITRGIAIGHTHLLQRGLLEVNPQHIPGDQVEAEVERFCQAVDGARESLKAVRHKIPASTRSDIVAFIDTHLLMLEDAALAEVPLEHIRNDLCAAEWALQLQRDALVQVFDAMEDPYLRTRKDDVDHVVNQIQKKLLQQEDEEQGHLEGKVILAQDLTPADTILLRHQGIAAFVTEYGGPMSHTAILARSLGIPAVIGVHQITRYLQHGEEVIVDGEQGQVLASADRETLEQYRRQIEQARKEAAGLRRLIGQPTITSDGHEILLMANIELPEDIHTTRTLQADAVGLYRTEFLYMNRQGAPDEEEHYQTYRGVVEGLAGIPVTIRTLDLGADKQVDGDGLCLPPTSCNPALGLRAIRLCLKEPDLFLPQLRAILRAAVHGPIRIMIPMLSNLEEVHRLKQMISEARDSLRVDGLPFAEDIPLGGMIEVPAAALSAEAFARELDFLSIGTNDLIQYTLAIDRVDDEVTYLYDPMHPAVLKLICMVIDAGRHFDVPVSMCGEMAGDIRYIPLLLGMGLRQFSMQPGSLLEAKQLMCQQDTARLGRCVKELMEKIDEPETMKRLSQFCNASH